MTEQDKFVEKVVLRNEFATEKQLEKAKKILEANPGKNLIQVLVHVKLISKDQAKSILKLYEKKRLKKKSVNQPQESSPINAGPAFLDDFHGGAPATTPAPSLSPAPAPTPAPTPQISVSHSGGGSFSSLEEYLLHARGKNASDLHINTDCKPIMRLHGSLIELKGGIFSAEEAHRILFSALTPEQQQQIEDKKGLDFSYIDAQGNRYRACIVKQRTGWNGAFRIIGRTPPTCDKLGLSDNIQRLVEYHQGLVLVTGPKGSGKTTTLASLIELINQKREDHIITIEDPVEYVFDPKVSHINQRQVGKHTESFSAALRGALREDPDVIMIGELRDLETTSLAISASETGHLVFGTLHTTSAGRTIEQIIDVFPPDQQSQIRTMISESIKGIICQQLLPRKDGTGRALALEVMFNTNAVANLIRERKLFQLGSVMQMGKKQGMVTLDHSLYQLVTDGVVDGQVAYYCAVDKSRFREWEPKKDFQEELIMAKIDSLFEVMLQQDASDLHLSEGQPPKVRAHGRISNLDHPTLTRQHMEQYLQEICSADRWEHFLEVKDLDFAYGLGDKARFRANYFFQENGMGAVFRVIPSEIKSLDDLNLPKVLRSFCYMNSGLILVTGPTGSGKSTTLAAMINEINEKSARHIITIEEPIEFVHPNKRSIICQREVGIDTNSFADGLKNGLRQDCDVILVGEMRDYETISLAVTAAASGTLVFGTLHTNSAIKTVDRIIDAFPADQQAQIRTMLSDCLKGVCAQLLLKTKNKKGRVACNEILIGTTALASSIREGNIGNIRNIIQGGKGMGMQLMDDAIQKELNNGKISGEEAYLKATDKTRFSQYALA